MTGSALLFPKTELFHTCAVCVPRLSTKRGLPQKFDSATGPETGVQQWTDDLLVLLANYYHVSIDYLLCQTNNPKRNL